VLVHFLSAFRVNQDPVIEVKGLAWLGIDQPTKAAWKSLQQFSLPDKVSKWAGSATAHQISYPTLAASENTQPLSMMATSMVEMNELETSNTSQESYMAVEESIAAEEHRTIDQSPSVNGHNAAHEPDATNGHNAADGPDAADGRHAADGSLNAEGSSFIATRENTNAENHSGTADTQLQSTTGILHRLGLKLDGFLSMIKSGVNDLEVYLTSRIGERHIRNFKAIRRPILIAVPSGLALRGAVVLLMRPYYSPSANIGSAGFGDLKKFRHYCPKGNRRTQTAVLIKLLSTLVTTLAVFGHLNSLRSVSVSRTELISTFQVLFAPIGAAFEFIGRLSEEIFSLTHLVRQLPPGDLRYTLSRLCLVHANGNGMTTSKNVFLGGTSYRHLKQNKLPKSLLWFGRLFLLCFTFSQYIQTIILIIRRVTTRTAAIVDCEILFLSIAGISGLVQSIIISLVNVSWEIQTDTQPCSSPHCQVRCCREAVQNNPDLRVAALEKLNYTNFSWIATTDASCNLMQVVLTLRLTESNLIPQRPHNLADLSTVAIYLVFIIFMPIYYFSVEQHENFAMRTFLGTQPDPASQLPSSENVSRPVNSPRRPDTFWGKVTALAGQWQFYFLEVGDVFMTVTVFFVIIYFMVNETSLWKGWEVTKPCPTMWKDELEDLLLWF